VFDEAHQLVETGVQFLGLTLGTGQCLDLARDLLALGLQHARGLRPWNDIAAGIEQAARELRLACAGPLAEARALRGVIKLHWNERAAQGQLLAPLEALSKALRAAADGVATVAEVSPDLAHIAPRAQALDALARRFMVDSVAERVRWIDLSPQQARLVDSPLDIREMLSEQRQRSPKAWVFTSATLGDDDACSWFTAASGLEDARTLRLGSPFDYARHARLWVPTRFAKPGDPSHPAAVGALAARLAGALGGRTFVLTTTLRVLPAIAEALRRAAEASGADLQLLVQGEQSRREMLQRYGDGRGAVLIGSQSFWEGIDMPGDALQCVVIDKLPFPPPNDPLVQARSKQIEARGGNAFNQYFVAEAAVSLKQGGGRLIRSESDRGLLVVCDPRLSQMGYGARLRAALPPMGSCKDEAEVFAWLAELAACHA
jgi:ATP-dependent DNA helicase DinG